MDAEGVTVVVTRTIKPGCEAAYEEWLHGVAQVATRFPGHLGITIFRPRPPSREYTLVFRFDTDAHLDAWTTSPERAEWARRAEPFTEQLAIQQLSGLETWFAAPGSPAALVPPRWKMVIVSWGVAFPLLQVLSVTLGEGLAELGLPRLAAGAIFGLAMVLIMTYVAMPYVTRALRGWLYGR